MNQHELQNSVIMLYEGKQNLKFGFMLSELSKTYKDLDRDTLNIAVRTLTHDKGYLYFEKEVDVDHPDNNFTITYPKGEARLDALLDRKVKSFTILNQPIAVGWVKVSIVFVILSSVLSGIDILCTPQQKPAKELIKKVDNLEKEVLWLKSQLRKLLFD